MARFLPLSLPDLPPLTLTAAIDIVIVAVLIYQFLLIIRGRRAVHVLMGLGVLALIYALAVWAKLDLLRTILATLAPYTPIALIVMFQAELRRALARLGRRPFLGVSQIERRELSQEVVLAVGRMSQNKVGALIVVERKIGLRTFVESGVNLDAAVSRDLLCSIFHPGGALHDGAVIIQGDRITAAACFLPLTTNPLLVVGARHTPPGRARDHRGVGLHRRGGVGRNRQGIASRRLAKSKSTFHSSAWSNCCPSAWIIATSAALAAQPRYPAQVQHSLQSNGRHPRGNPRLDRP